MWKSRPLLIVLFSTISTAGIAHADGESSGGAGSAAPEPSTVREMRRLMLAVATAWPVFAHHDTTVPLPGLRIGFNISPRVEADLTGASIPFEYDGRMSMVEVGIRVFTIQGPLAPYGVARAGIYFDDAVEQGPGRNYPYIQPVGVGLDYSGTWGFTAFAEVGPTLMWYQDVGAHSLERGIYMSVGLGYRVRTGQPMRGL